MIAIETTLDAVCINICFLFNGFGGSNTTVVMACCITGLCMVTGWLCMQIFIAQQGIDNRLTHIFAVLHLTKIPGRRRGRLPHQALFR